jgi:two-component system OmpR family response regulator
MSAATTIVFARDDLSIPGAAKDAALISDQTGQVQADFFELVDRSRPDVIVLDFSNRPATGTETILTIRQRTDIPILVVCYPEPPEPDDYRIAGAADWIPAPVDIVRLNQTIQKIVRVTGGRGPRSRRAPQNFVFARISFYPRRNLLVGEHGATIDLTSSEGRLLGHFLVRPWTLCTRSEIAELLYGPENTVGDRAIDVVVNRLRKKLTLVAGAVAEQLIKTEFKRGYLLVADVATLPHEAPAPTRSTAEPLS